MITLSHQEQQRIARLTDAQRGLFLVCGVFVPEGAFTAEALLSVWQGKPLDEEQVNLLLPQLRALLPDLLTQEDQYYRLAHPKFHIHTLVELTAAGKAYETHRQHLLYYQRRSEAWAIPKDNLQALAYEVAQYRHAFDWARLNAYDHVIPFILAGCQHLSTYPLYHQDIQGWLDIALSLVESYDEEWCQAGQLRALGDVGLRVQHLEVAKTFYYLALQRYGESSTAGQAHTLKGLGDLSVEKGQWDAAVDFYYKALVLYEVADFPLGQANTLKQLAELSERSRADDKALAYYQRAIRLFEKLNFELEQANVRKALGDLYTRRGEYEHAQAQYEEAYILYEDIEFWTEQGQTELAMGQLQALQGNAEAARQHYENALPIFRRGSERRGQADTHRALGDLSLRERAYPAALEHFGRALDLYRQIDAWNEMATLLQLTAHLYLDTDQPQMAVATIADVLPVLDQLPDPLHRHEVQVSLREVAQRVGAEQLEVFWQKSGAELALPPWLLEAPHPQPESDTLPLTMLVIALESPDNLREALLENTTLTLHYLSHLAETERGAWIEKALALCTDNTADAYLQRALLLKEVAGVMGHPVSSNLHAAIAAFDGALSLLSDSPQRYAQAQNKRVALLRDMAGMGGENRRELLFRALEGCDTALAKLGRYPEEYAYTQLHRAHLLRELAGLSGEDRGKWMRKALQAFDEVWALLSDVPLQRATAQTNRASILQEIAILPGENQNTRLRQALAAAADAVRITDQDESAAQYQRTARRMLSNVAQVITTTLGQPTFEAWWMEQTSTPPPTWLKG
jgi:tetratricopeptide (TPR) repeat protein